MTYKFSIQALGIVCHLFKMDSPTMDNGSNRILQLILTDNVMTDAKHFRYLFKNLIYLHKFISVVNEMKQKDVVTKKQKHQIKNNDCNGIQHIIWYFLPFFHKTPFTHSK